jgi:hypothetical protein
MDHFKLMNDVEKAIEAGTDHVSLDESFTDCKTVKDIINYINKNGIEVEYLKLPITDLNFHFMVRMSAPFPTVLDRKFIEVSSRLALINNGNTIKMLENSVRAKFIQMMRDNELLVNDDIPIKLVELKLVRDEK